MAEDLLEKGAIIQRDKATYTITPPISPIIWFLRRTLC
jgi:hypothetical protein